LNDIATAGQILSQDDGLGQFAHWPTQAPALIPKAKVGLLLRQIMPVLQDTLGAFHDFSGLELAPHFGGFFEQSNILFSEDRFGNGSAHLLADKGQ
jgi:hypothetical protein